MRPATDDPDALFLGFRVRPATNDPPATLLPAAFFRRLTAPATRLPAALFRLTFRVRPATFDPDARLAGILPIERNFNSLVDLCVHLFLELT